MLSRVEEIMKTFLYILQFFSAKSKKYIEKYLMITFVLEQKFIAIPNQHC